jgi:DNA-binding XRE family transcriptional regulator
MTGSEYRALRETVGTQAEAAERLDVARNTIARRERGELSISREVEYAMRWVAERAGGKLVP